MTSDTNRNSNTATPTVSPTVFFANSPEITSMNPMFVRTIPGANLGQYLPSFDAGGYSEIDVESLMVVDAAAESDSSKNTDSTGDGTAAEVFNQAPSLSDISLISNQVTYDAAGNPSVTAIFRIKNSSGKTLKGVNARVQVI